MPKLPDMSEAFVQKRAAMTKASKEAAAAKAKDAPPPAPPKPRIAKGR